MKRWDVRAISKVWLVAIVAVPLATLPTAVAQVPSAQRLLAQQTVTVLEQGSTGSAVKELQAMLALMGYYSGAVDGLYEQATIQAVRQFQTDAGLVADGIVGPMTWQRLLPTPTSLAAPDQPIANQPPSPGNTVAPEQPEVDQQAAIDPDSLPVLRLDDEGSEVRRLQELLAADGLYTGPADGIFGLQTEQAVRQFQEKMGLFVDGVVGPTTWRSLLQ